MSLFSLFMPFLSGVYMTVKVHATKTIYIQIARASNSDGAAASGGGDCLNTMHMNL